MVIANSMINFRLSGDLHVFMSFRGHLIIEMFIDQLNSFGSFFIYVSYFMLILTFISNEAVYYLINTKFKQAFKVRSNVKSK